MPSTIALGKLKRNIWLLGTFKIPMLGFARPKLLAIDADQVVMKIKLRRRTKNHLNSMYFGALAVGADTAAGIHAYYLGVEKKLKLSLAFKSCKAEFLKRAETDVTFVCKECEKLPLKWMPLFKLGNVKTKTSTSKPSIPIMNWWLLLS